MRRSSERPSMDALPTKALHSSMNAKIKRAPIHGALRSFLHSSLNARINKRPSVGALSNQARAALNLGAQATWPPSARSLADMAKSKDKDTTKGTGTIALNKRARFEYHIDQRYEAGVALQGWELKALRAGRINFGD